MRKGRRVPALMPQEGVLLRDVEGELLGRLMGRVAHGPVYQLQAVVVRTDPLTAQEKQDVRALFEEAKKRLAGQVLAQLEAKT